MRRKHILIAVVLFAVVLLVIVLVTRRSQDDSTRGLGIASSSSPSSSSASSSKPNTHVQPLPPLNGRFVRTSEGSTPGHAINPSIELSIPLLTISDLRARVVTVQDETPDVPFVLFVSLDGRWRDLMTFPKTTKVAPSQPMRVAVAISADLIAADEGLDVDVVVKGFHPAVATLAKQLGASRQEGTFDANAFRAEVAKLKALRQSDPPGVRLLLKTRTKAGFRLNDVHDVAISLGMHRTSLGGNAAWGWSDETQPDRTDFIHVRLIDVSAVEVSFFILEVPAPEQVADRVMAALSAFSLALGGDIADPAAATLEALHARVAKWQATGACPEYNSPP